MRLRFRWAQGRSSTHQHHDLALLVSVTDYRGLVGYQGCTMGWAPVELRRPVIEVGR
jgi:hypothetical protein